jgi:hypothetical protein
MHAEATIVEVGLEADLRERLKPERPNVPSPFPQDAGPLPARLSSRVGAVSPPPSERLDGFRASVRTFALGHAEQLPEAVRWRPLREALEQIDVRVSAAQLDDLLSVVEPTSRLEQELLGGG